MREEMIEKKYEEMGISKEVYLFGKKIEDELKERFAAIDATAEYNQMKVIDAMQKNRVSAECFLCDIRNHDVSDAVDILYHGNSQDCKKKRRECIYDNTKV